MRNEKQIAYWNGPPGERWASLQGKIDRNLGQITERFVSFAAPKAGERVLDIGCGCGTTTLIFALAVQPDGTASGIDISAPMLAVARARAQAAVAEIPFVEGDASTFGFQPVFDLVVSRFGVMFFDEPAVAFANIRKALAPKGRLAFVCWRSLTENVWATAPLTAALSLLPPQEPPDPTAPGPFAFADGKRIETILTTAGFRDIRVEKFDGFMDMGATAEDAARDALNIGPLARVASELDEDTRERIRKAVVLALSRYVTTDGVRAPAACWFVRAEL